jgi:hypothetical protein
MSTPSPLRITEGFRPRNQNEKLMTLRIDFGPAFAPEASMRRNDLILLLRQHSSRVGRHPIGGILNLIAQYMDDYAAQLPEERRRAYLSGVTSLAVDNVFYYGPDSRVVCETHGGCSFKMEE